MPRAALALALLFAFASAPADAARQRSGDFTMSWLGLGIGMVNGEVELDCRGESSRNNCDESGVFPSLHADLTIAGPMGFRIRGVRAEEDTRHRPRELAVMLGARVSPRWYFFLGHSSIRHADNEYDGHANGLALELVRARRGSQTYMSFMGAHGKDVSYFGFSFGLRLGDVR